jgi:hypothetical protein
MKILLSGRVDLYGNERVRSYFTSIWDSLVAHGHKVTFIRNVDPHRIKGYGGIDLLLDVECGRDFEGVNHFIAENVDSLEVPSAVLFTDSHGNPTLHRRLAKKYDHVFYAVWDKRDLFEKHPSAHWLPNYTDLKYFDGSRYADVEPEFLFGFFGSKGGISRADPMIAICRKYGWKYDVREIGRQYKHRWPRTATAMANCRYLFNHGQKHDLNFRVFESMAVGRCLVNDRDPRSGIDKLFEPGVHYVEYEPYTHNGLETAMLWCVNNRSATEAIARKAFTEVTTKHTVHNRVEEILEVVGGH